MAVAFFDFDRTLLSVNSAWLWVRRELRLGHLSRFQAAMAALWVARYQLGFLSLDTTLQEIIASLKGVEQRDIVERTRVFYEEELRGLYRPGGLRVLEYHRSLGDTLVLLTSSTSYLSELVVRELRMDAALCNTFEVDAQGLHTGRAVGAICFGVGKLRHARDYAQAHGVALEDCTFYTDSYSDVSVMHVVGRPVAVNPDQRLRREAGKRGWNIVDWGVALP